MGCLGTPPPSLIWENFLKKLLLPPPLPPMCFSSRRAELETPVLFYLLQTFIKTKGSRNNVLVYNSISSSQKFVSKTGDVCHPALVRSLSNSREVFAPPLFSTSTKEPCHKHENQIIAKQVVKTCYSPEQEILI